MDTHTHTYTHCVRFLFLSVCRSTQGGGKAEEIEEVKELGAQIRGTEEVQKRSVEPGGRGEPSSRRKEVEEHVTVKEVDGIKEKPLHEWRQEEKEGDQM